MGMRTVTLKRGENVIHIATPLGIVNIYLGLHDKLGRRVETVTMRPNEYAGEPRVMVRGRGLRFVECKAPSK